MNLVGTFLLCALTFPFFPDARYNFQTVRSSSGDPPGHSNTCLLSLKKHIAKTFNWTSFSLLNCLYLSLSLQQILLKLAEKKREKKEKKTAERIPDKVSTFVKNWNECKKHDKGNKHVGYDGSNLFVWDGEMEWNRNGGITKNDSGKLDLLTNIIMQEKRIQSTIIEAVVKSDKGLTPVNISGSTWSDIEETIKSRNDAWIAEWWSKVLHNFKSTKRLWKNELVEALHGRIYKRNWMQKK